MVYNFVELLIAYFTPYATEQVRIKNLEALCKKLDKVKAKPPCCCMGTLHPGECVAATSRVPALLVWLAAHRLTCGAHCPVLQALAA